MPREPTVVAHRWRWLLPVQHLRDSNFEMQAAIGVGPNVIFDVTTKAVGLFHITAAYAW